MITADISISKLRGEKSLNLSIELLISQLDLEQESLTLLPRVAWGTQRHTPELLLLPRACIQTSSEIGRLLQEGRWCPGKHGERERAQGACRRQGMRQKEGTGMATWGFRWPRALANCRPTAAPRGLYYLCPIHRLTPNGI